MRSALSGPPRSSTDLTDLTSPRFPSHFPILSLVLLLLCAPSTAHAGTARIQGRGAAAERALGETAACASSPTTLCLNGQRFKVEVRWKDFEGKTGSGQAIALTGDTGYFWFFSSSNVELVVKVLDGRALNASYWVFYGALSNVEYTMTVTDTVTGNVKRYVNPSGSFGSVGDTSAFPSAGSASTSRAAAAKIEAMTASAELALREALLPAGSPQPAVGKRRDGASAAALAPTCVPTATSLCLNGSRFRVEVSWTDFAGKTGVGTPVALTGDTGYFWFFSSNNVELTVKVLDARGLNNRFWVFYGALSNVEYVMTVTDILTGNVNTYSNPSGQFASVGDTEGFRAGSRVAVTLDTTRAVSKKIPREGGDVSATAADGSTYSLHIPAQALLSPQTVTLTPAGSVDGLPLSGGLTTAVQITPNGLSLSAPATLTVVPARQVALAQQITFGWRGAGDEFFLYPPNLGPGPLSFSVMTFAGYGVGAGTTADVDSQLQRAPSRPADELSQNLEPLDSAQRRARQGLGKKAALNERDSISDAISALLLKNFRQQVLPQLQSKSCSVGTEGILSYAEWLAAVDREPGGRTPFQAEIEQGRRAVLTVSERCYNEAYQSCVAKKQPEFGFIMAAYYDELKKGNAAGLVDAAKIQRCLTFDLDFGSRIEEHIDELLPFSEFLTAKASFRPPDVDNIGLLEGTLSSPAPACTLSVGTFPCPTTTSCDWKGLGDLSLRFDYFSDLSGFITFTGPTLRYVPNPTKSTLVIHIMPSCSQDASGDVTQDISVWYRDYVFTFHQDEYDGVALTADGWEKPGWMKKYNRSSPDRKLDEFTVFALTQKPQ